MSHINAKALPQAMSRDVMAGFYPPPQATVLVLAEFWTPDWQDRGSGWYLPASRAHKAPCQLTTATGAGRRHRATTYQQPLAITDLRSCPWASGDRFSKAVPLVWEKQLVKEFPESELLSLLASLGFPDEKAWPKPSWTRLLFSWLSFDLDELV